MSIRLLLATAVLGVSLLSMGSAIGGAEEGTLPQSVCGMNAAQRLGLSSSIEQVMIVAAPTATSTAATFTRWGRVHQCFVQVGQAFRAVLGWNGLSAHRHEGDGTTPIGAFSIGSVMYGIDANPGVAYAYHRLVCGDWWDESSSSPQYNQFVHVACGSIPSFAATSEALWREAPAYDAFAVIDFNIGRVVPGAGSAIFLHVAASSSTNGCVALSRAELLTTLRWLEPAEHPEIVINTAAALGEG